MLILLSPAKKLDFESDALRSEFTLPEMLPDTTLLAKEAKKLSVLDLKNLMGISDKLAELNVARFKAFETPFTLANAKQSIDSFKGDVYQGLDAATFTDDDIQFAQKSIRILSGFYGLLRPLDLIQPYRLEMGVRFQNQRGPNLYQFWGSKITDQLNIALKSEENPVVVNLASNEYFKSVKKKELDGRIVTPIFKECKGGNPPKVISFLAKKARGIMSQYIVKNRIENVELIKDFTEQGYYYSENLSQGDDWVFIRTI